MNVPGAKRSSRGFENRKPLHWGFATGTDDFSISTATSERTRAFSRRTSGPWAFGFLTNENNFVSWTHENLRKTHVLARIPDFSGRFAVGRKNPFRNPSPENPHGFPGFLKRKTHGFPHSPHDADPPRSPLRLAINDDFRILPLNSETSDYEKSSHRRKADRRFHALGQSPRGRIAFRPPRQG